MHGTTQGVYIHLCKTGRCVPKIIVFRDENTSRTTVFSHTDFNLECAVSIFYLKESSLPLRLPSPLCTRSSVRYELCVLLCFCRSSCLEAGSWKQLADGDSEMLLHVNPTGSNAHLPSSKVSVTHIMLMSCIVMGN